MEIKKRDRADKDDSRVSGWATRWTRCCCAVKEEEVALGNEIMSSEIQGLGNQSEES